MVRGADGKEYGPATLEQTSSWVKQGRILATHEIRRSDMEYWSRAGDFEEFQPLFGVGLAPAQPAGVSSTRGPGAISAVGGTANADQQQAIAAAQTRSGGSWFYWIAGLSLINSISAFAGSTWRFVIGLGVTQILDLFGNKLGPSGKIVVLGLDLLVAGVFILFGVFAVKGQAWAFIVGMVLFTLDGLIFLLAQDWLGIGFHVFVLYCLFRGFNASRQLNR